LLALKKAVWFSSSVWMDLYSNDGTATVVPGIGIINYVLKGIEEIYQYSYVKICEM
jgi:hypothetical protein